MVAELIGGLKMKKKKKAESRQLIVYNGRSGQIKRSMLVSTCKASEQTETGKTTSI